MKKFGYLQGKSMVGSDIFYHLAEWHYSRWELIGCPQGYNCGVHAKEVANVWKCVGEKTENCFPIGDHRYDLAVDFFDHTNELAGIKAVYGGEAGRYSVHVYWQWNDSVEFGRVHFNHIIPENETKIVGRWAHAHEVCPEVTEVPTPEPDHKSGQMRPGAIVVLIVRVVLFRVFRIRDI
jgi:hypothetical protein